MADKSERQIPVDQLLKIIGSQQVEIALLRGDLAAKDVELAALKETMPPTTKAAAGTIKPRRKR